MAGDYPRSPAITRSRSPAALRNIGWRERPAHGSGQSAAAEDAVTLWAPGVVRTLLEQGEAADLERRLVGRQQAERTLEGVVRKVVRHGHVWVVGESELA